MTLGLNAYRFRDSVRNDSRQGEMFRFLWSPTVRHPISPRVHGVLDFPRPARRLFESLAAGYTGLSAVTNYPLSAKRLVPFKAHGATEAVIALALPAMPKLLGFSKHRAARNLCFGLTALTFVVAALTDWNAER